MVDDAAFLARLKHIYTPKGLDEIEKLLKLIRKAPNPDQTDTDGNRRRKHLEWKDKQIARVKQPFLDRMHDLSCFVTTLGRPLQECVGSGNARRPGDGGGLH